MDQAARKIEWRSEVPGQIGFGGVRCVNPLTMVDFDRNSMARLFVGRAFLGKCGGRIEAVDSGALKRR